VGNAGGAERINHELSLRQCFDLHGCDRGSARHRYDQVYEPLFEPIRNEPLRILEIGVFRGAGVFSWLKYFPRAEVVGLDTFQRVPLMQVACGGNKRVRLVRGDSTKNDIVLGSFDLIFDDGAHDPVSQILTFAKCWPRLKPGGMYFIEDVDPARHDCIGLFSDLAAYGVQHHDRRLTGKHDSYILEVRKC